MKKIIKISVLVYMSAVLIFSLFGCDDNGSINTDFDSLGGSEYTEAVSDTQDLSVLFDDTSETTEPVIHTETVQSKTADSISTPDTFSSSDAASKVVVPIAGTSNSITAQPEINTAETVDEQPKDNGNENKETVSVTSLQESVNDDSLTDTYVLNKNTRKFHYSSCASCATIKEKNKATGSDREKIISEGYQPCKRCNP